jgi:hypothetical protein
MSLSEIRSDPVIKKALSIKSAADAAINLERIVAEADMLHSDRASRSLYKISLEPTKLAQASMQDMSNRARLSELKARVYVQKMAIEHAFDHCTAHISTQHRDVMRQYATNAADRKMFVNKVLNKLVESMSSMTATLDLLEIYIKDIDQSAWALRNATEMMKILMDVRGKAV